MRAAAPSGLPLALVVEDDEDVAYLLSVVLTQAGFDVVTARDGLEGTRMAREHDPVLTTIDIAMPNLDGLETTRRIREFSDSYIVIVSTRSDELDILAGFDAGADDYVPKPIRPRELRARLTAVTRRPSLRLPSTPVPPEQEGAADPGPPEQPVQPVQPVQPTQAGQPGEEAAASEPAQGQEPGTEPGTESGTEPGTESEEQAADEGEDGKAGMLRVGMQFVGSWIEFRGLRMNPARGLVVVDDRLIDLHPQHLQLLELMLYSGTRTRTSRELALGLRAETEEGATSSASQDAAWVESLMLSMLGRLDELARPVPRWIDAMPNGRFRLVRPE